MDKALQKVSKFYVKDKHAVQVLQKHFELIQELPGANKLFKRIASASDKEQLDDYLAEALYVLVFAGLGFQVEIEPFGNKGPDLRITRDSQQAVVEIMRFRKVYSGIPVLDFSGGITPLPEYGNLRRDIRKAFEKIQAKFDQVGEEDSVIAIWNDEEELEDIEVEWAVRDIRNDASRNLLSLPNGLQFVLYASKWVRAGDNKQIYCFPIQYNSQPQITSWQRELNTSTINELVHRALVQSTDTYAQS